MSNKEFVDLLKERVSVVDVISRKVKLTRKGHDYFGICPFHNERTPSFKVSPDKGMYYCFGCGAHGDMFDFVMNLEKVQFTEAVTVVAELAGLQVPKYEKYEKAENHANVDAKHALAAIKKYFMEQLHSKAGAKAHQYLVSRMIDAKYVEQFELGFAANSDHLIKHLQVSGFSENILLKTGVFNKSYSKLINRYSDRLMFPISDANGQCVGFGGRIIDGQQDAPKYINSPESDIYVKSNHLYGYSIAKKSKTRDLVLVEGYLDVISMHQAGFDCAVAPLGTSISDTQINMCWRISDAPVVALDGDGAGNKAAYRWAEKILPVLKPGKSFKFAILPQDMDPDSLVRSGNKHVLQEAINNSVPLVDWLWSGAFSLYTSETPEQKSAIVSDILKKVESIQDILIKKIYSHEIRQKSRNLYTSKKNKFANGNQLCLAPVMPSGEKIEKILLASVIVRPHILSSIIEDFVKVDFKSTEMSRLKDDVLRAYEESYMNGKLDEYTNCLLGLKEKINLCVMDSHLYTIFSDDNLDDDTAIETWNSMYSHHYTSKEINNDLQMASFALKSSFSDDNWQKLKALKQEAILDRKKK